MEQKAKRKPEQTAAQEKTGKRAQCVTCLRAQSACICSSIVSIQNKVEVVILQHPMEVHQAKGSARLLYLCLPNSRILVGEQFNEKVLEDLLATPLLPDTVDTADTSPSKYTMLLYPDTNHSDLVDTIPPPIELKRFETPEQLRLIILDGTWRKSRKMLYLNPALQALPRLSLQQVPASQYAIRKAHRPEQLSTFEATAYALMQLEQDAAKYQPLLQAFHRFISQQVMFKNTFNHRNVATLSE
jgi:DTW domain-containing protein YfiP